MEVLARFSSAGTAAPASRKSQGHPSSLPSRTASVTSSSKLTHSIDSRLQLSKLHSKSTARTTRRASHAPVSAALVKPPSTAEGTTSWTQKFIELPSFKRGCHIITRHIHKAVPEISEYSMGIAHIFVMHTSCSLTINENASPDVPLDMEDSLNRIVPEGNHYRHLDEGYDDMPAHVKASLMGFSLTVPIAQGRLALGTWQGIWLNEHRDYGGSRRLVITIQGIRQ